MHELKFDIIVIFLYFLVLLADFTIENLRDDLGAVDLIIRYDSQNKEAFIQINIITDEKFSVNLFLLRDWDQYRFFIFVVTLFKVFVDIVCVNAGEKINLFLLVVLLQVSDYFWQSEDSGLDVLLVYANPVGYFL